MMQGDVANLRLGWDSMSIVKLVYRLLFTLLIVGLFASASSADTQKMGTLTVSCGEQTSFIKGFPLILRLTFRGPITAPDTTLFSNNANLKVVLTNQEDKKQYEIYSSRGAMDYPYRRSYTTYVKEDAQRTTLLDLQALFPELGNGKTLYDVPPGNYAVQIEVPKRGIKSNVFTLSLKASGEAERLFLGKVTAQSNPEVTPVEERAYINWPKMLIVLAKVSDLELTSPDLSEDAQRQIKFYRFWIACLRSLNPSQHLDELRKIDVPKYLTPDKDSTLLELAFISQKPVAPTAEQDVQKFATAFPDLAWRLQDAREGKAEYLWFFRYDPKPKAE